MPIPTPLDVASRALQPAAGLGTEFRTLYQQGIRSSLMVPQTRLVALTLASLATDTGQIPADAQPGLAGLAAATGLRPGQVAVNLRALETRGWLSPLHGERYDAAVFRLTLPLYVRARQLN
ncbi:hypothetical protein ABZ605_08485 [Streptomyces sp. NPDC012765]|uniref:hypothetical protein n=1 Tax=Streptomyces sp. NPDC012765 TaxID=3155249 RepID=UPI0034020D66